MKKYDKPLVTTNFNDGSFVAPDLARVGLCETTALYLRKMFDSSFVNAQRLGLLEPVIA